MRKRLLIFVSFLILCILVTGSFTVPAKTSDKIIFKDKNLQSAISRYYNWNDAFTKDKAGELSKKNNYLILDSVGIFDLDGLQYFSNLKGVDLSGNNLNDLSVLSKLDYLNQIVISYNNIKGKKFENLLNSMGIVSNLQSIYLREDEISCISFLNKIGDIDDYINVYMDENQIKDITVLENALNLKTLDLSENRITDVYPLSNLVNLETLILTDNRITDVTPLKNLSNLTYWLDLKDNCIIDYKPIKPILDKIYEEGGWEDVISRYDYYSNPVDVGVNGKTIKFPYLTAYYKYQAYVEAIPLFKALGGSAQYNKKTGTLTCKYDGYVLVFKDFSKSYTLNGKKMSLNYPMRRMQYDMAYVPVKDICKALGLNYSVTKKRKIFENEDEFFYAPKIIEITKAEKELG